MSNVSKINMSRRTLFGLGAGIAATATMSACSGASTTGAGAGDAVFFSTQFAPVEEKQRFEKILATHVTDPKTSFTSMPTADFTTQLKSQVDAKKLSISAVGALHGDLTPLGDYLEDVDELVSDAKSAGISDELLELGKLGGSTQKYIPWMQASYVICANKKALQWLPAGADVNAITYDQYLQWAVNAKKANGKAVFGFPAGPKGLYHRFLQGYLLPSFTGGTMSKFTSPEALKAWEWMAEFWKNCNPASTNYDYMQEPLSRGEVLVSWDHVARLADAPKEKPEDWVMVPSPIGPKGLGYLLIVAGMGVPKGGDKGIAGKIIQGLSTPEAQIELLKQNSFFPVVKATLPSDLAAPAKMAADAIAKQAASPKAVLALPPLGLGDKDGEMSQVFKDLFREICLQNVAPATAVKKYAAKAQGILDAVKVPCWAPDPDQNPCQIG
ncbi:ABC transporter substrate-binding protein [Luteococcus sp. H138]|uniref:ABC transporter substrate-binding protein n=1 Tax=unclassified Luteococcus TaxID=2639923 RepID=UPI00313BD81F